MFDALFMLVTHIMDHPLAEGPIPDPSMFVDTNAYQLFRQFHHSLVDLGPATLRLTRARRLQFLPGPPGLPGQYCMDPTAYFPPHPTDFLSIQLPSPLHNLQRVLTSALAFPLTQQLLQPESGHAHETDIPTCSAADCNQHQPTGSY